VHEILNTKDVKFAEGFLNDTIVGEGDALFVNFSIAALVD
jgi:hypothetical protein